MRVLDSVNTNCTQHIVHIYHNLYRVDVDGLNQISSQVYNGHSTYVQKDGREVFNLRPGDKVSSF